jgi:hypothetical protein
VFINCCLLYGIAKADKCKLLVLYEYITKNSKNILKLIKDFNIITISDNALNYSL